MRMHMLRHHRRRQLEQLDPAIVRRSRRSNWYPSTLSHAEASDWSLGMRTLWAGVQMAGSAVDGVDFAGSDLLGVTGSKMRSKQDCSSTPWRLTIGGFLRGPCDGEIQLHWTRLGLNAACMQ